jgi:hypothetical protein
MTTSFARRLGSLAAISALLLSGLAAAQSTGGPSKEESTPPGASKAPEQAAIDACKDHKAGDRVKFVDGKGKTRKWGCAMVGDVLAARSGVGTAARMPKAK